jgi:hypothetical protein
MKLAPRIEFLIAANFIITGVLGYVVGSQPSRT